MHDVLTGVLHVVAGVAKHVQRTDEVEGVKTFVEGKEDFDLLWLKAITVLCNYCTHLAGIVWWEFGIELKF